MKNKVKDVEYYQGRHKREGEEEVALQEIVETVVFYNIVEYLNAANIDSKQKKENKKFLKLCSFSLTIGIRLKLRSKKAVS